jgi:hypothetical protein
MVARALAAALLALAISGCPSTKPDSSPPAMTDVKPPDVKPASDSLHATDGRLDIRAKLVPGTKTDRIPRRTIELTFKNVSKAPLRIFLPKSELFRATISTIYIFPESGASLAIPEPHPHGYVITEADFFLLAPGEERMFPQTFSLDPMVPGPGTKTARRPGFEAGKTVSVTWEYKNDTDTWPGGVNTFDGVTKPLFGGKRIEDLWTGTLTAKGSWKVPD